MLNWTGTTGGIESSSPAVANGVVYVGSDDGKLYAFDAAGATNCAGSPKTCAPLWTATTGEAVSLSPAVANGVVYVTATDLPPGSPAVTRLHAFDAAGSISCLGSPKTCSPLWSVTTGGSFRRRRCLVARSTWARATS
jgi:outer membrane protein assembly factor BamB